MVARENESLRAAIAGMLAMAIAMGIGRFVYTPILPHMLSAGVFSTADAGLLASFNFLGYLVGAIAAAWQGFAPRRRRWFVLALATSAATSLAMGLTSDFAVQAALRLASGIASAFSMIFATTIVMAVFQKEERPGLIAVHFAGVGVGITLSALLVSALSGLGRQWQDLWIASGILAAAAWLVSVLLLPDEPQAANAQGAGKGGAAAGKPFSAALWFFIAGYGFFGFGYVITATFLNTIARSEPALAPLEPWIWVIVGISGIPSIWLLNRLANARGAFFAYIAGIVVEAIGIALLYWKATPLTLVASGILLGGTFIAATAIGLARARIMGGPNAASAIAIMTAAFGLGQIAGPLVAGLLHDRTGSFDPALLAALAALAFTVIFTLAAGRTETRHLA